MKKIGPTFGAELAAAGITYGVAWSDEGLTFTGLTAEQEAVAREVYDAHDPSTRKGDLVAANIAAVQAALDRQAQAKGYDNIVSACSYAAGPEGDPFAAEGRAFLAWRSAAWAHAHAVLAEVESGHRPMPTPEESVAMMPALVLP